MDARRVAPDFGAEFPELLVDLALDGQLPDAIRTRFFAMGASLPLEEDPHFSQLPENCREEILGWDR